MNVYFVLGFLALVSIAHGSSGLRDVAHPDTDASILSNPQILLPIQQVYDSWGKTPYRISTTIIFEDGTSKETPIYLSFDSEIDTAYARFRPSEDPTTQSTNRTRSFVFSSLGDETTISVPVSILLPSESDKYFWFDPEIFLSFARNSNVSKSIGSFAITRTTLMLNPTRVLEGSNEPIARINDDANSYLVSCQSSLFSSDGRPTTKASSGDERYLAELNPTSQITLLPSGVWKELFSILSEQGDMRFDGSHWFISVRDKFSLIDIAEIEFGIAPTTGEDVLYIHKPISEFFQEVFDGTVSRKSTYRMFIRENEFDNRFVLGYHVLRSRRSLFFNTQTGAVEFHL